MALGKIFLSASYKFVPISLGVGKNLSIFTIKMFTNNFLNGRGVSLVEPADGWLPSKLS